jgi:Domain of unknown function (DUF4145)
MAQLALPCPHCRAEKIGFAPRGAVPVRPGDPNCLLFLQCLGCGQAIVAVMQNAANSVNVWAQGSAGSPGPLLRTYPESQALAAPADVPPTVAAAFLSGLDNLGRKGGANAAGAMFRRSIELAARAIDQDAPARIDLKQRIERLPDSVVTPAMKQWAQHIRLEGNDAVHGPDEYSDQDAKDLHTFAELFLLTHSRCLKCLERQIRLRK